MVDSSMIDDYVTEARARAHLMWAGVDALRSAHTPDRYRRILHDLRRLASEIGEWETRLGVADCAEVATTVAVVCANLDLSQVAPTRLASVMGQAINYRQQRLAAIDQSKSLLEPDADAASVCRELLGRLRALPLQDEARQAEARLESSHVSGDSPATLDLQQAPATSSKRIDDIPPDVQHGFLLHMSEELNEMRRALVTLGERGCDAETLLSVQRPAHKIKGTAGTMQLQVIARVAFEFEGLVAAIPATGGAGYVASVDAASQCLTLLQSARDDAFLGQAPNEGLIIAAQGLRAAEQSHAATYQGTTPATQHSLASAPSGNHDSMGERDAVLRVEVGRLDELLTQVTALAMNRASMNDARADLARMQDELRQAMLRVTALSEQLIELNPITHTGTTLQASQALLAQLGDTSGPPVSHHQAEQLSQFDHSIRVMNEAVHDVTSLEASIRTLHTRMQQIGEAQEALMADIQQDVIHLRLVPLSDWMPGVHLAARMLAAELRKRVRFTVRGESTQLDREIGQSLAEPLLQLVRNAVTHGIESPAERALAGKSEEGEVWLRAHYVGNEVFIEVGDDGRGVNPQEIVASALSARHITAKTAATLTPEAAVNMMFLPGVTTYGDATLIGGRGVGLDEVHATIASLKGSIEVSSAPGQGTVFRIRAPISLSITRVLHVRAGEQGYAIPFSYVQRMTQLSPGELLTSTAASGSTPEICHRIRVAREASPNTPSGAPSSGSAPGDALYDELPAYTLPQLLGQPSEISASPTALLVEFSGQRIALLIDSVREDRELVVRALPAHLRRRVVRGATVTADGQLLLLLDLPAMLSRYAEGPRPQTVRRQTAPTALVAPPRVLVVDDSISIRRALELDLKRAGFDVQTARDGIDALQTMLGFLPRVIVLDIEMPRLDGFEFLTVLRDSPQFADVRVIMLTSRASGQHRADAERLGANDYVIKPCPIEVLVAKIHALLTPSPSAPGSTGE